jgi:hypothetical protein
MNGMSEFAYLGCGLLLTAMGFGVFIFVLAAIINYIEEKIDDRKMYKERRQEENKRPRAAEFYSKELLDLANEPPSEEELERLRKEIEEWESRTNKFYRSSEDE